MTKTQAQTQQPQPPARERVGQRIDTQLEGMAREESIFEVE